MDDIQVAQSGGKVGLLAPGLRVTRPLRPPLATDSSRFVKYSCLHIGYSSSRSDVSTSICSSSSFSARAAATRSSSRFISAMHNSLHWFNFPQRVTYKLCLLTYKCLHGLAPDYLTCVCVCVCCNGRRSSSAAIIG